MKREDRTKRVVAEPIGGKCNGGFALLQACHPERSEGSPQERFYTRVSRRGLWGSSCHQRMNSPIQMSEKPFLGRFFAALRMTGFGSWLFPPADFP